MKFVKNNRKYICVALMFVTLAAVQIITAKTGGNPITADISEADKAVKNALNNKSMLTLNGEQDGVSYNWYYDKGKITAAESENVRLNFHFDSRYNEEVKKILGVSYVKGFVFENGAVLAGEPVFTLRLTDTDARDIEIYRLTDGSLAHFYTPAVNKVNSGTEVSFPISGTKGFYFVTGGFTREDVLNSAPLNEDKRDGLRDKIQSSSAEEHTTPPPKITDEPAKESAPNIGNSNNSGGGSSATESYSTAAYLQDSVPKGSGIPLSVYARKYSDGKQSGQDKWKTDPVPDGKPLPVNPGDVPVNTANSFTCTLSVDILTVLDNTQNLKAGKDRYVTADGYILKPAQVIFYDGETVFDVLQRECEKRGIHMESSWMPVYNSAYIEGINNLYEFDCGNESGWMYSVNGWYPNYGSSRYMLQSGDVIKWRYTCNGLGKDVGSDRVMR